MDKKTKVSKGKITFYSGPMYSEKSFHLILKAEECQNKICFKPSIDTRENNGFTLSEIVSRRDNKKISAFRVQDSKELYKKAIEKEYEYIFVDETQFFDENLANILLELKSAGKTIFCSGLDLYANRNPWPTSQAVSKIADEIIPLTAECRCKINDKKCGEKAIFTFKFSGDLDKGLDIGNGDKYVATCEKCWDREAKKQKEKTNTKKTKHQDSLKKK